MISILLGYGLRRAELAGLKIGGIQISQGHWVIVDLVGKGGRVRTVPMPAWVKGSVDQWLVAANLGTC
jgi:site-specific recombinase XerC